MAMKVFIVNYENKGERIEMNISENMNVEEIKSKLDVKLAGDGNFEKYFYRLVYKNIVFINNKCITFYKLHSNDEIKFGKIENILKRDEVIMDLFLAGQKMHCVWLIAKTNDSILTVKSIIKNYFPNIMSIWNVDGKELKENQTVAGIAKNGNYKIIISHEHQKNYTFEECRNIYYKYILERYLSWDKYRDNNNNKYIQSQLKEFLNEFKTILLDNITLNIDLSQFPPGFINSFTLFCMDIAFRIEDACPDYCKILIDKYNKDVSLVFKQYFKDALINSVWNYVNTRSKHCKSTSRTMKSIVIDALEIFEIYLNDENNNWKYWMKLKTKMLLENDLSDSQLYELFDKYDTNNRIVTVKSKSKIFNLQALETPKTVGQAKEIASSKTGVAKNNFFYIKQKNNCQPHDDDLFEESDTIEIIYGSEDIKIMKLVENGAYSSIFLCKDKLTENQFVLKTSKNSADSLYRDISTQCLMKHSDVIPLYSQLFKHENKICFAMKYYSNGSLLPSIKDRGKLSEFELSKFSYQVLLQIQELHNKNIVHRDIKSDNIVFDEEFNAKIIDFGMAKCISDCNGNLLKEKLKVYKPGTLYYMAPEVINSEIYSHKIDIWSFGVTLMEAITGDRLYKGFKAILAVIKIAKTKKIDFQLSEPISDDLSMFKNACLNSDPEQRFDSAQLMDTIFIQNYLKTIDNTD